MKKVLNSQGKAVVLNQKESFMSDRLQKQADELQNALGFKVDINTLTAVIKSVSEQKFFEIRPSEYMPVKVGEGAWSDQLLKYSALYTGGDFEEGVINTGSSGAAFAETNAGMDSTLIKIINWGKGINWSLFDLKFASSDNGSWDVVTQKEKSRKRNWDLGIQKIAFIGSATNANVKGLLNQSGVTSNTSVITEPINGMTAAEFNTFVKSVYEAYRSNSVRSAKPTHFIIPESDFNGLVSYPDATYPLKTKLQLLEEAFKTITMNPNFKILPCAYAETANSGLTVQRYVMLNYDEDTLRMDIPVDYTSTLANTIDGFMFQNVAYGQFSGVNVFRPLEVLYFDYTP